MEKLKRFIKKYDRLYVIARCFWSFNDPRLQKLIRGYYESNTDNFSVIINKTRPFCPGIRPIYRIELGCDDICTRGFGAMLRYTLESLSLSDILHYKTYITWGRNTYYYDSMMDNYSTNVFAYYFDSIVGSEIPQKDAPYILASEVNCKTIRKFENYRINESDITYLADLYKKYIRLNDRTETYLAKQLRTIHENRHILGVHVRGTDFAQGLKGHPHKVPIWEYINAVKKVIQSKKYDGIFLATDDLSALNTFKDEFGNLVICYDDAFRTVGNRGSHTTPDSRPFHRYRLGLEALRDIYTLAYSQGFVCGMSQISCAVRYVNRALDRKFDDFILLDNGINKNGAVAFESIKLEDK